MDADQLWQIYLLKECVMGSVLFRPFLKVEERIHHRFQILSFMNAKVGCELEGLKENLMGEYLKNILVEIKKVLEEAMKRPDGKLAKEVVLGRLQKNAESGIKHSVIFGDNGGLYLLLNSVTKEEKCLLEKAGEISQDYGKNWKKKKSNEKKSEYKIVIGKGTFGKIRLALALTRNPLIPSMYAGQIVCVKKTRNASKLSLKRIRENCWNDYSSGEISKYIYSPIIYDLKIMWNRKKVPINHLKGCSFQQFQPFFDGKKAFTKDRACFGEWKHQRSYLMNIFEGIHDLISKGVCMTDLKLGNTLYDPINRRGVLIDLAGVVCKVNQQKLEKCKLKYIKEVTPEYTAPELMEALKPENYSPNKHIDLCKCVAFSLGVLCEKTGENTHQLRELIGKMKNLDVIKRISVEEGIKLLRSSEWLPEDDDESFFMENHLPIVVRKLIQRTQKDLGRFGLNPNFQKIQDFLIKLKCTQLDPERYPDVVDLLDIHEEFQQFINNQKTIFLLLGCSGSGKSTFLQIKYWQSLQQWKKGDPFPFYMNLAAEDDLRHRWEWMMNEIDESNLKFSLFSGIVKYPMMLFLDSFDEVTSKTNLIFRFFDELGRHPRNKFMMSCRSEFICNEQRDFNQWFRIYELASFEDQATKRYIVPLDYARNLFDWEQYLRQHFHLFDKQLYVGIGISDVNSLIRELEKISNLNTLLKTS